MGAEMAALLDGCLDDWMDASRKAGSHFEHSRKKYVSCEIDSSLSTERERESESIANVFKLKS